MPIEEAQQFLQAAQGRLELVKRHEEIRVSKMLWVVGSVQGAPVSDAPKAVELYTTCSAL